MRSDGHGPASHTAGSRYCRATRPRGAVPRATLTVRHTRDGLLLVPRAGSATAEVAGRSWRGAATAGFAVVALVVSVTLLLTGAYVRTAAVPGPCPARTSISAYADGRHLLVRAEPARGATTLLHLCAERSIGPVRDWQLRLAGPEGRPVTVAVERVARSVALAAAPLTAGRRTAVVVTVVPDAGRPLTFSTHVTAG